MRTEKEIRDALLFQELELKRKQFHPSTESHLVPFIEEKIRLLKWVLEK